MVCQLSSSTVAPESLGQRDCDYRCLGNFHLWIQFLSCKQPAVISKPEWVDFPGKFDPLPSKVGQIKLDRFNARRHLSEVSWVGAENKKHNLALQCWKVIVLDSTMHTGLGRTLAKCIELGKDDEYVWQVVADAFAHKSTSTLKTRASSLLSFGRWRRATGIGSTGGIFPVTEDIVYEYLCELRRMHAAPSKGKRFLEALGFAKGLLGADVDSVITSARVRGVALGFVPVPSKKKDPFTVEQLMVLEPIATHGAGQEAIFCRLHVFYHTLPVEVVRWPALHRRTSARCA